MPRKMARTWHFDVNLQVSELSQQKEITDIFQEVFISANERLPICGLQQYSFFYVFPQDVIAQIFGYLHVKKKWQVYLSCYPNLDV
jgi:hypothetical protein